MKPYVGRSKQKGVGLSEVMVAMLLLGIAVVGFAALQVRAIGATNESGERTQAMAIATDLAERVRLNNTALAVYRAAWNPTAAAANLCETAACNPAQMANYDIRQIVDLAATTLPNGRVAIVTCPNRANGCIYVSWNNTTPTIGSGVSDCSQNTGFYVSNADCVIAETY